MRIPRLAGAAALALLAACGQPRPTVDTAAVQQAIRDRDQSWNQMIVARNDSGIAALYTADGVLMPPNQPSQSGAASIRAFWAGLWQLPDVKLVITPGDIQVAGSGDMAAERGTWTLSAGGPQPMKDNGKYVVVWVKGDNGEWHAATDIWNSDNAPPAAGGDSTAAK